MTKIILYGLNSKLSCINELREFYNSEEESYSFVSINSDQKFNENIISSPAIFIFHIANKMEFAKSLNLIKATISGVNKGTIKIACIKGFTNPKFEKMLELIGCRDYLAPNISAKSLKYKIEIWNRSIQASLSKQVDSESEVRLNSNVYKLENLEGKTKTDKLNTYYQGEAKTDKYSDGNQGNFQQKPRGKLFDLTQEKNQELGINEDLSKQKEVELASKNKEKIIESIFSFKNKEKIPNYSLKILISIISDDNNGETKESCEFIDWIDDNLIIQANNLDHHLNKETTFLFHITGSTHLNFHAKVKKVCFNSKV